MLAIRIHRHDRGRREDTPTLSDGRRVDFLKMGSINVGNAVVFRESLIDPHAFVMKEVKNTVVPGKQISKCLNGLSPHCFDQLGIFNVRDAVES